MRYVSEGPESHVCMINGGDGKLEHEIEETLPADHYQAVEHLSQILQIHQKQYNLDSSQQIDYDSPATNVRFV